MQKFSLSLGFIVFVSLSNWGEATPYPGSMTAIGDSTSTATLAQYKRSQAMNPFTHANILYDFLRLAFTRNKQSLSDWKYSWSTGLGSRKVESHAGRLKKLNRSISVSNFAEPGANVENVWKTQLPKLRAWSQEAYKKSYPDYLTLMVGANDICADSLEKSTSVKNYVSTYSKILNEILASSKSSRVLVSALPPYEDLIDSASAGLISFPGLNKCGGFWKVAPLCKSITHGGPGNKTRVAARVKEMNKALRQLVTSLRKRYGDRLRFAENVSQRHIHQDDLSIDCFHPNAAAQNDLAEITWSHTWWAGD